MWNAIKQRKHKIFSWAIMMLALAELGSAMEVSWYKFFLVLAVFMSIEYYTWAQNND